MPCHILVSVPVATGEAGDVMQDLNASGQLPDTQTPGCCLLWEYGPYMREFTNKLGRTVAGRQCNAAIGKIARYQP